MGHAQNKPGIEERHGNKNMKEILCCHYYIYLYKLC